MDKKKDLRLRGKIEELPEEIHVILASLECLSLENSNLDDASNACVGEDVEPCDFLTCSMWQLEERAMPRLRGLRIPEDLKSRIPERIRSIPSPAEGECEET
ncbi:hypothetical protein WN944_009503 [Citrus x changshan-huyou]|uniref:Uncharacterized protein n=1 Tax=Citrus x changshan-huyou TaxID=2935761 RepID=A0AAP0MPW7_9ROSI